jgi:hypothetical protein
VDDERLVQLLEEARKAAERRGLEPARRVPEPRVLRHVAGPHAAQDARVEPEHALAGVAVRQEGERRVVRAEA